MARVKKIDEFNAISRVRMYGQPVSLGLIATLFGGFLVLNIAAAFDPQEGWILSVCTILLLLLFLPLLLWGISYLLTPFERVWVSQQEVRLCIGKLTLRKLPVEQIRSITATTREIRLHHKDQDLYRMKINFRGRQKTLWMDWSIASEAALREKLKDVNFLL